MPRMRHWYRQRHGGPVWAAVAVIILLHTGTVGANVGGEAEQTVAVASVLLDFVHIATASQREVLHQILDNPGVTAPQRTLALALLHVLHTADPRDVPELGMLMNDCAQSPLVQTLARVIHDLEHTPTDDQKRAIMCALDRENGAQSFAPTERSRQSQPRPIVERDEDR